MQIFNHTPHPNSISSRSNHSHIIGSINHPTHRILRALHTPTRRIRDDDDDVHDDVPTPRVIHNPRVDIHNHAREILLWNIHVITVVTVTERRTTRGV